MEKAKIFYFSVFVFVVVAFIFHVNAMGHHHWKKATSRYYNRTDFNYTTIGLFTRCVPSEIDNSETCYPNIYPRNSSCTYTACEPRFPNPNCQCDFSSSTKGIAACAIIAAIFLGLVIIILFIHSIKTTASRSFELFLGLFPLILLLLALIFILITLILVGSYLSRDIMYILRTPARTDWTDLRQDARNEFEVRVDWATGLEIIAIFFTFLSLVLYSVYVFKLGRSL